MITDFLLRHSKSPNVSFHMPGHKGDRLYRQYGYGDFLDNVINCDITEIAGADNLFQAEGVIKGTMDKYTRLYGVRQSYLLVNGTSGGIMAAIMASVPKGRKLLMARNCHKSVFNALLLAGIQPVYVYPEMVNGISGAIHNRHIEECLKADEQIAGVILPSPNYYGICSDIGAIARICRKYHKVLIVDQAHGAHLKFFSQYAPYLQLPKAAEECGADIVINSIHKTMASMTQSAVLNLNSDRVDRYVLEDKLQMIQSTSPSYVLMASLDVNAELLMAYGHRLIEEWAANIDWFEKEAARIPGLRVMKQKNLDRTKVNIDMSLYGINGQQLEELLMARGIYTELTTGNIVMCMSGIGNYREDFERLLGALEEIAALYPLVKAPKGIVERNAGLWNRQRELHPIPERSEWIPLKYSAGRICASSIIPYPPGIPFLCPGERIDPKELEYIKELRQQGEKVIGVNDKAEVRVGIISGGIENGNAYEVDQG